MVCLLNQLEKIKLPRFEDFIIEEEEGSGIQILVPLSCLLMYIICSDFLNVVLLLLNCPGGYGTVYRAQRKNDGKRFAIKCKRMYLSCIYVTFDHFRICNQMLYMVLTNKK